MKPHGMIIDPSRLFRLAATSGGIYPTRIPAFIIYFLKVTNSFIFSLIEKIFFGRRISNQKVQSPVIILGHYRSGTTFLHRLLLTDKRFGFMTYMNVISPFCSVLSGRANKFLSRYIQRLNISNWAFNNTVFKPEDPSEEDMMMASAGMRYSFDWGFIFPLKAKSLMTEYVLFRDNQSRKKWQDAYLYTVKKLSYKNKGKRLLLKNPPNTGRIKALLELFPDARFIFIYRNPYHVFLSTQYLWQHTVKKLTLQKLSDQQQEEIILNCYLILMNNYQEEKNLIPEDNLVEIRYEDLKKETYLCLEKIYNKLDIEGFDSIGDDFRLAVSRENRYVISPYHFTEEIVSKIENHWGAFIEKWNYEAPAGIDRSKKGRKYGKF